jgi:ABC-type methionine transport system ATPase subunit
MKLERQLVKKITRQQRKSIGYILQDKNLLKLVLYQEDTPINEEENVRKALLQP